MNGAERLLTAAASAGVETCFVNPGTTEVPLLLAFDRVREIRPILALSESVAAGAADGHGRMLDAPALTLTHLGPSFANGIANLHNARRARSPVVNVVGDHPRWHVAADPPLASDIASLARPVSRSFRQLAPGDDLGEAIVGAIDGALAGAGGVATLVVPSDLLSAPAASAEPTPRRAIAKAAPPTADAVRATAARLRAPGRRALVLGGRALRRSGLRAAARVAAATACELLCETFPSRVDVGPDLPGVARVPYVAAHARAALGKLDGVILIGTRAPVAFFADEERTSALVPEHVEIAHLVDAEGDAVKALEALADELGAPQGAELVDRRTAPPHGPVLTGRLVASEIAALHPEGTIVIDEGISNAGPYLMQPARVAASYLCLTGGACGFGLSAAIGAAIACPDRAVVALVGDGSALYAPQALWTHARHGLHVVTVVLANGAYKILEMELALQSPAAPGPVATSLTDLDGPAIDWVSLSGAMGVPARRVDTSSALRQSLEEAFRSPGPQVIEVQLRR